MKGPFSRHLALPTETQSTFRRDQTWYCTSNGQKVRKPLPYTCLEEQETSSSNPQRQMYSSIWCGSGYSISSLLASPDWGLDGKLQECHNKAYQKFLDGVRTSVGMGTDLAEYKETLNLLSTAFRALRNPVKTFTKQVKRYKHLGPKAALKDMPNAWLAFHFGVEPLVRDVYSLIDRLSAPKDPKCVTTTAKCSNTYSGPRNVSWYTDDATLKGRVRISAFVTRENDNLALMNDLGLLNPLSIAWELVPYSFVADWFFPVGQYINSISDLAGYKVHDCYVTWFASGSRTANWIEDRVNINAFLALKYSTQGFRMQRSVLGEKDPSMVMQHFPLPEVPSLVRSVTAVSLLLQNLRFTTTVHH